MTNFCLLFTFFFFYFVFFLLSLFFHYFIAFCLIEKPTTTIETKAEVDEALESDVDGLGLFFFDNLFFQKENIQLIARATVSSDGETRAQSQQQLFEYIQEFILRVFRKRNLGEVYILLWDPPLWALLSRIRSLGFENDVDNWQREMRLTNESIGGGSGGQTPISATSSSGSGSSRCKTSVILPALLDMQVRAIIGKHEK